MKVYKTSNHMTEKEKIGGSLLDSAIYKLPFELHIPSVISEIYFYLHFKSIRNIRLLVSVLWSGNESWKTFEER